MTVASDLAALVPAVDMLEKGLTQSNAERDAALSDARVLADKNAEQAAEIAALKAGIPPVPTPVPTPVPAPVPVPVPVPTPVPAPRGTIRLGATLDLRNGHTRAQENADWEATHGPLQERRIFLPGPPTKANVQTALADCIGKRDRILSYKGEGADDVFQSIPQDGFKTYLVKYHEPENDGGTHTANWFIQVTDEEIGQIQALGRPDLLPAFVLMGWADNDGSNATSSTLWFPTKTAGVTMLLDPYEFSGSVNLAQYVMKSLTLWRSHAGQTAAWGIAEMGTYRKGASGAQWITDALTFAKAEGALMACWFNSAVNGNWWMDDPLMQAAWKAAVVA